MSILKRLQPPPIKRILIACECSGTIRDAYRRKGYDAYSCDIQRDYACSRFKNKYHIREDVLTILSDNWDLMIAHPPCTYLSVSGALWYYHPEDTHLPIDERRPHPSYPNRQQDREDAVEFFLKLVSAPIPRIAIENPIGIMSNIYRKPDQIIHPYMFGHPVAKATCLWLKRLPLLQPTNIVDYNIVTFASGKSMSLHYYYHSCSHSNRAKIRSKTFQGVAEAIATQWI